MRDLAPCLALSTSQVSEVFESLAGQAKALQDLEAVVRTELRASHRLLEARSGAPSEQQDQASTAAAASTELPQRVEAQGRALARLDALVCKIGSFLVEGGGGKPPNDLLDEPTSAGAAEPSASSSAAGVPATEGQQKELLESRMSGLEEGVAEVRQHMRLLVAAMRHVRDSAAEALEDRVAVAIGEVHRRTAEPLAGVHERLHELCRAAGRPEDGQPRAHRRQCSKARGAAATPALAALAQQLLRPAAPGAEEHARARPSAGAEPGAQAAALHGS